MRIICPECGRGYNLYDTPKNCPFCRAELGPEAQVVTPSLQKHIDRMNELYNIIMEKYEEIMPLIHEYDSLYSTYAKYNIPGTPPYLSIKKVKEHYKEQLKLQSNQSEDKD